MRMLWGAGCLIWGMMSVASATVGRASLILWRFLMSLRAPLFSLIPEETVRVAQAAFPNGNVYMRMRDELGLIYDNALFADLFPHDGQPAQSPAQLALVTIMQFAEGLADRPAADAVRAEQRQRLIRQGRGTCQVAAHGRGQRQVVE